MCVTAQHDAVGYLHLYSLGVLDILELHEGKDQYWALNVFLSRWIEGIANRQESYICMCNLLMDLCINISLGL
jgi:hypothetical protein